MHKDQAILYIWIMPKLSILWFTVSCCTNCHVLESYMVDNQGWVEKSDAGRKLKLARQQLTVGTWNVRTLREIGKLQQLRIQIKRSNKGHMDGIR